MKLPAERALERTIEAPRSDLDSLQMIFYRITQKRARPNDPRSDVTAHIQTLEERIAQVGLDFHAALSNLQQLRTHMKKNRVPRE